MREVKLETGTGVSTAAERTGDAERIGDDSC